MMRLPILLFLLACVPGLWAQSASIAELPTCALLCLETAIGNSICSAANQTCVCTNVPLQESATTCIAGQCTVKEALFTKNVTQTICGAPVRDKGGIYKAISNSFGSISGGVIIFRLVSKYISNAEFGLDDYFVVITLVSGIPSSILTVRATIPNGLGKDIWTVPFNQITAFVHAFYAMEVLYFLQVALLKLSLLFFYLRVFPGPKIRRFIWGTIIFDILFGLVFILTGIFQCRPISYYWNSWDGEHEGKCVDINALAWANAGISILLDAWMLGLPMSQVIYLNLHWKKKVGVALMFIVGTFVTVVSILRLQSLLHFAKSTNPTWDNVPVSQWSTVEINVGIICVCMPSIRLLLVRLFPKVFGTTMHSTHGYHRSNSHNQSLAITSLNTSQSSKPSKLSEVPENGIQFSQSYDVHYGKRWDNDETNLVPLENLNAKSMKSSNRLGKTEV